MHKRIFLYTATIFTMAFVFVGLAAGFAGSAQAHDTTAIDLEAVAAAMASSNGVFSKNASSNSQVQTFAQQAQDDPIPNGDVTIAEGEAYIGDLVRYSGDITVESNSRVQGGVVAYSGDVLIEEGAVVEGDIIAVSGDLRIYGEVVGALVVWSGDVAIEDGATIHGDVSVMNGDIDRGAEATVEGNIIVGPKIPPLPPLPGILDGVELPNFAGNSTINGVAPTVVRAEGWNQVGRFVLRIIGAFFLTALVVFMTGIVYYLQPEFIQGLRGTLTAQKPTSFVIGLLLNVVLTMLIMAAFGSGNIFTALCLAPLSFVALLLFLILNTGGWAVLSIIVGERLLAFTKVTVHQLTALLVGATAMTGTIALVWALGSCMRPVAYLIMLTLSALGGGSLIIHQLQKRNTSNVAVG